MKEFVGVPLESVCFAGMERSRRSIRLSCLIQTLKTSSVRAED
jgi:hypothetical protein